MIPHRVRRSTSPYCLFGVYPIHGSLEQYRNLIPDSTPTMEMQMNKDSRVYLVIIRCLPNIVQLTRSQRLKQMLTRLPFSTRQGAVYSDTAH